MDASCLSGTCDGPTAVCRTYDDPEPVSGYPHCNDGDAVIAKWPSYHSAYTAGVSGNESNPWFAATVEDSGFYQGAGLKYGDGSFTSCASLNATGLYRSGADQDYDIVRKCSNRP